MAHYIVSIEGNRVVIHDDRDRETVISSVGDLDTYLAAEATKFKCSVGDLRVFYSSTMDFPHDSTSDPAVLALVSELNQLPPE